MGIFYRHLIIYSIGSGVLAILCLTIILLIPLAEGLVYSTLPSLTDILPIERVSASYMNFSAATYVIQWFLFMYSIFLAVIVYIKYREYRYIYDKIKEELPTTYRFIVASLVIGCTMATFLMILPYLVVYSACHYFGLVTCILICAYQYTDVHISILMYQDYQELNSYKPMIIIIIKAIVMVIGGVSLIIGSIFWELAIRNYAPGAEGSNYVLWNVKDWGYGGHLMCAIFKWIFALTTFSYFSVLFTFDLLHVRANEPNMEISYIEYYY